MTDIQLREITADNWRAVARLKLAAGQEHFVAPNWYSMLEALHSGGQLHSRAIYTAETLVGYVMYGFDPETGWHWIVRLMTDQDQQAKGYGRAAMRAIIDTMQAQFSCDAIYISFVPENTIARRLYEQLGFVDTGQIIDDELVFRLALTAGRS